MQVIFSHSPSGTSIACTSTSRTHASEKHADGYITRIVAFCKGLTTFPRRGTQRDDLLPGLRVTGFERRAAIAFVVTDAAVLIEGIF